MSNGPSLGVFKFASCDGCQLSLLDCEDEILAVAKAVRIANFPEASRAVVEGPYDVALVEGSVTTAHDLQRLLRVRQESRVLVTIGACATAGGIQALRNAADVAEYTRVVYAHPEYINTLERSTPIAEHVKVDYELRGCPVNKRQLLDVLLALLHGRKPDIHPHPVCVECKMAGITCVMVAHGTPCLGPVTHAGCGALCPSYARGCFGCYGPAEDARVGALAGPLAASGAKPDELVRLYSTFNVAAPEFQEGQRLAGEGGASK
ncbi:MAG: oxidoreductase [Myxococcales bacterium]|nr:oxidoreductase [Myxococcales bacterium]